MDKQGAKFVLKILNVEDSKNATLLEVQTMSFLRQRGVHAQTAMSATTGQLLNMEVISINIQVYKIWHSSSHNLNKMSLKHIQQEVGGYANDWGQLQLQLQKQLH